VKTLRTVGILLAVILALGGLATWDEWQTKKDEAAKKTEKKLAEFSPDDVVELAFVSRPEKTPPSPGDSAPPPAEPIDLKAVKTDGAWRLTKPVDMLADQAAIDNFLRALSDYQYEKVVATGADKFADYGLKEAAREVHLKFAGGKETLSIYVGSKAPVGFSVYARSSQNEDVVIGGQHLLTATTKTLHEFRDKTLVKIDEKSVATFAYVNKDDNVSVRLERKDGTYRFVPQEPDVEADTAAVKEFIDELNNVRVDRFVDAPTEAEQAKLAKPDYVVTWTTEHGDSTSLLFSDVGGKLLVAYAAPKISRAFELADAFRVKAKRTAVDFRNRRILRLASDDITQVEVDGDSFRRIGGDWYKAADATKLEADPNAHFEKQGHIRALLVDLEFAKTDAFLKPGDPAVKKLAAAPEHRLKLAKGPDDKAPVTLDLFADAADTTKYIVRVAGAPSVYRVAKVSFNSMIPGAAPADTGGAPTPADDLPVEEMPPTDMSGDAPSEPDTM
jgi:hypothetical protein